jgi:hypothetical protein
MRRLQAAHAPQICEELPTGNELKDQVEIALILGESIHVNDEGVGQSCQNRVLGDDVVDLFEANDLGLFQDL